jgi:hypothetical protein
MNAQEQFEGFLSKYEPGGAAEAKKSLAKSRKLIPNAMQMVYDTITLWWWDFVRACGQARLFCRLR